MEPISRAFLVAIACVSIALPAGAQIQPSREARLAIGRGEALFNAQNYAAALTEFEQAYELLDGYSRRFTVLANIGACHERLFHYDVAIQFYGDYLREGGELVEDHAEVEARMRSLDLLLVTLTLASNVAAEIWVDNRNVGRAPATIRLSPGKHVIELRATLHEAARREVHLTAGSNSRLDFTLVGLSQYSGVSPAYFWSFAGLTVAAVGVGAGFGISALAQDTRGHDRAKRDRFLATVEDEESVQRAAAAADIAFIGAAVLGVSAAVLFFVTDWDAPRPFVVGDSRAFQVGVSGSL